MTFRQVLHQVRKLNDCLNSRDEDIFFKSYFFSDIMFRGIMFMISFLKPKNIDFSRFSTNPNSCNRYMVYNLFLHFSNEWPTINYHLYELEIHIQVHVVNWIKISAIYSTFSRHKWVKVFKNGPSKICKRQLLKIFIGPFLNTLTQIYLGEKQIDFNFPNKS